MDIEAIDRLSQRYLAARQGIRVAVTKPRKQLQFFVFKNIANNQWYLESVRSIPEITTTEVLVIRHKIRAKYALKLIKGVSQ